MKTSLLNRHLARLCRSSVAQRRKEISTSRNIGIPKYRHLALSLFILLFSSCEYKDLCYNHNHWSDYNLSLVLNLNLDLELDQEVTEEAHTKIELPTYMVVCFYDTLDGSLRKTEFVGPYGGNLQVSPGSYDMVIYAFDTEWTQVRGEGNRSTLEAFTSDITATKSGILQVIAADAEEEPQGPIIYTPDHL